MRSLIAALLVLAICAPAALARKWTDSTGTHTVEAEFMDFQDGKVQLKKEDGTIVSVPLEKLNTADQDLVRKSAGQPREEKKPPASAPPPRKTSKTIPKPSAKPRDRAPEPQADAVEPLLAAIRNKGANPFKVDVGAVQGREMATFTLLLMKGAAEFRLKDNVAAVQKQRQEKQAVEGILQIIQETQAKRLPEKEHKAVCFLAMEALGQLSATSNEALASLNQLQSHADPVISLNAKMQIALLKTPGPAPGRRK